MMNLYHKSNCSTIFLLYFIDQFLSHPVRYPSKIKYSFVQVFLDLLNFAADHLVLNGRLVYWLPIIFKE